VSGLGAILTAIVTPFDDDGAGDEQAFVELMAHLARNGSDGFVVCGTTGEAATLDDDEHLRVIELAEVPHAPEHERHPALADPEARQVHHSAHVDDIAGEIGRGGHGWRVLDVAADAGLECRT